MKREMAILGALVAVGVTGWQSIPMRDSHSPEDRSPASAASFLKEARPQAERTPFRLALTRSHHSIPREEEEIPVALFPSPSSPAQPFFQIDTNLADEPTDVVGHQLRNVVIRDLSE